MRPLPARSAKPGLRPAPSLLAVLAIAVAGTHPARAAEPRASSPTAEASMPAAAALPDENTDVSDIAPPREARTSPDPSKRPPSALSREVLELEKRTGLKLGLAYTTLFQQASGGIGERQAAAGDVDFTIKWTLAGRGTKDTGQLVVNSEYRHEMGAITPSQLAGGIGALNGTTNGFGTRPLCVKETYWIQRFNEDKLRLAVGRIDTDGLFAGHALQSANTSFLNKAFSTSPTVPLPGAGATFGVRFAPNGRWTGMFAATNARGNTTRSTIDELLDHGDVLAMGELGFQPKIEGAGQGRYRIAAWHVPELDSKPSDWGLTFIAEQDFGEHVSFFARAGWADEGTGSLEDYVEAGAGWKGLGGRKGDLLGAAVAWTESADETLDPETVGEVFQRFAFGPNLAFTVSAQLIFDPAKAPDDDVLAVFSGRLRFWF